MYFNIPSIDNELNSIREAVHVIQIGKSYKELPITTQDNVDDFLTMFNEYKGKIISENGKIIFNGNPATVTFTGIKNPDLKLVGLHKLVDHGKYVMNESLSYIKKLEG